MSGSSKHNQKTLFLIWLLNSKKEVIRKHAGRVERNWLQKQYKYNLVVILNNTNISANSNNIDNQFIKNQ